MRFLQGLSVATSVLLLSGGIAAQSLLWRVNCGGGAEPAPSGPPFLPDVPLAPGGSYGYLQGSAVASLLPIGGASNSHAAVHRTARVGWRSYAFDVPNGPYIVRLHFAEVDPAVAGPGQRRFGVQIEGATILDSFDVAALVGTHYAVEMVVPVNVADGRLEISSILVQDPALLNAIEVWSWPPDGDPPAPPSGLVAKPGTLRNIVAWDAAPDADVAGWIVDRSSAPGGPWTSIPLGSATPTRFLDQGASTSSPTWYRVRAVDAFGNVGAPSFEVSAQARTESASPLRSYALTIDPAQWAILDATFQSDPKFTIPAVFSHGGSSWNVQVRYRGANSKRYSKKSWNVKLPSTQLFEGREELNLKAHFDDFSTLRQEVAIRLLAGAGHATGGSTRCRLSINGVDRGLFEDIEEIDEHWLAAQGIDAGASLYKLDANLALLPSPADYAVYYSKKTNEATGNADLIELIELLHATPAPFLARVLADRIDVDAYLGYLAVLGWVSDPDSIGHNAYLVHDLALGRWQYVAWDNDLSFGGFPLQTTLETDYAVDFGAETSPDAPLVGVNHLKSKVLSVPELRWRYCEKLKALMEDLVSPPSIDPMIAGAHALVQQDGLADVEKWGWESDALFLLGPPLLQAFGPARSAFLQGAIAAYQPAAAPTLVWINEVLADNATGDADEHGEHEPWIELHNATAQTVDVGAMVLTDDLGTPLKYRIPAGTAIGPFGSLRIWADGQFSDGPLHTPFRLEPAGGEIGLFAPDGATLLDFAHFRGLVPDVSWGRVPDGGAFFRLLGTPTPGAPNDATGNLPPAISWVEVTPSLPLAGAAATITCKVVDADALAFVRLHWRTLGGGFSTAAMSPLPGSRYGATIPGQPAGVTVEFWIEAQDADGKAAMHPPHAPDDLHAYTTAAPAAGPLRVNEILADNQLSPTDEAGDHDDWIEVHNTGDQVADLTGLYLSDSFANPKKWAFPAGTTIPPKGTILVWADDEPGEGPLHATFKLSKSGEEVGLFDSDARGNALLHGFAFGPQATDVSLGLLPDGGGALVHLLDTTPGAANVPPPGSHVRYASTPPTPATPKLTALGPAVLGQVATFQLDGAAASSVVALVHGTSPLVLSLPGLGVLLLLPEVYELGATDASGAATIGLALPSDPVFAGLAFYTQAFVDGAGLTPAVASTIAP